MYTIIFEMGAVTEILKLLEEKPRQTPSSINKELDISVSYIKSTLSSLVELELVKRVSHGLYEITELGEYVLKHNIEK